MAASALLYGIVQVPAFMGFAESPQAALTGAIACGVSAVLYCVYSVVSPDLQRRKIEAARKRRLRLYVVKVRRFSAVVVEEGAPCGVFCSDGEPAPALLLSQRAPPAPLPAHFLSFPQALAERTVAPQSRLGSLVDPATGRVNRNTLKNIFDEFDTDSNGTIDAGEVQALMLGLQLSSSSADGPLAADRETIDTWFAEMDVDQDRQITFDEFYAALSRWVAEKLTVAAGDGGAAYSSLLDPRRGGATAALLADLPAEDLAQLRVSAT